MAGNTAIYSIAIGVSRIAGLVREIVASSYFGTSGAYSAFTIAFQVPNLVRSLVADAALSSAFVPVFSELLERGERRQAFRLASTLFLLILAALGALVAIFVVFAGAIMPLFTGHEFTSQLVSLTVGLAQVLFPIVVLLGLNGLVVGILNAHDHFTVPAIAPVVWNVVIIVIVAVLRGAFHGANQLYAYAIGVLVATAVQFAMALSVLGRIDLRLGVAFDWRNPLVRRILRLMLPVSIALGVVSFDVVINSSLGSLVSRDAPRAIDAAFRVYQLPQGVFSIALTTVLFPALSRLVARDDRDGLRSAMASGTRQLFVLLVPAAAFTLVLATPIVRLIYQHGAFNGHSTALVSTALFWFSFSLPFGGVNLMLTRTFFALQRPWWPTGMAVGSLAINAALSLALYRPLGIAGLVIGTAAGNLGMTIGQLFALRRQLGRIELVRLLATLIIVAGASAAMAAAAYGVWSGLDAVLGRSLIAQIFNMIVALGVAVVVYFRLVLASGIPEAAQLLGLIRRRLAPRHPTVD